MVRTNFFRKVREKCARSAREKILDAIYGVLGSFENNGSALIKSIVEIKYWFGFVMRASCGNIGGEKHGAKTGAGKSTY